MTIGFPRFLYVVPDVATLVKNMNYMFAVRYVMLIFDFV